MGGQSPRRCHGLGHRHREDRTTRNVWEKETCCSELTCTWEAGGRREMSAGDGASGSCGDEPGRSALHFLGSTCPNCRSHRVTALGDGGVAHLPRSKYREDRAGNRILRNAQIKREKEGKQVKEMWKRGVADAAVRPVMCVPDSSMSTWPPRNICAPPRSWRDQVLAKGKRCP